MHNGTYVEIGALDGVRFSNTWRLHKCFGWNGLLVEGNPRNYERLIVNRNTGDKCVHSAVCAPPQTKLQFTIASGPVSGALNEMSDSFKSQWHPSKDEPTITVACRPMSKIMAMVGITHVDFFSLDVEGAELTVLETIDFIRTTINVFLVELDRHDPVKNWKIIRHMHNLGYTKCTCAHSRRNGLFVHARILSQTKCSA